jgi:DNA-binding LacI/PurR family transcriptional regulator
MSTPSVGLDDIARKSGVAISTVSRALRDLPGIHPKTRNRVLREAESLGYNTRPRRSEGAKSESRHVLILTVGEETPTGYMAGLSRASLQLNISLHLHHASRAECAELLSPRNLPLCLREEMISGIILVYRWPERVVEKLSRKYATVSILHTYAEAPLDVLGIDHAGGMFTLVRHFKASGHAKIGFLGLDPQVSWARARFSSYLEALLAAGLPLSMERIIPLDLARLSELTQHMADRVQAGIAHGVRGWICADDFVGYDLCAELLRRGVRIPDDVAIAGFHRHPAIQHKGLPLLTSTTVDSELMGASALRQLFARMTHPEAQPQITQLPAAFFQGQTTQPVKLSIT